MEVQTRPSKKRVKRLKICVTQREIDGAVKGNSRKCMIQESIKRDHPEFKNIWVDKNQVRFTDPKANVIYTGDMPALGRANLLMFDAGEELKPFDVWVRNVVCRERELKKGVNRAKAGEQRAKNHRGPIPIPLTKEARRIRGRDRIFGQKLWTDELDKLRRTLLPA